MIELRLGHSMQTRRTSHSNVAMSFEVVLERLSGPHDGLYFGTYVLASGTAFVGYAKVFAVAPSSTWDAGALLKATSSPLATPEDAARSSERWAALRYARLMAAQERVAAFATHLRGLLKSVEFDSARITVSTGPL